MRSRASGQAHFGALRLPTQLGLSRRKKKSSGSLCKARMRSTPPCWFCCTSEAVKKLGVDRIDTAGSGSGRPRLRGAWPGILGSDKFLLSSVHAGGRSGFPPRRRATRMRPGSSPSTYGKPRTRHSGSRCRKTRRPQVARSQKAGIGAGPAPVVDAGPNRMPQRNRLSPMPRQNQQVHHARSLR